jgi:hypothetical protein
MEKETRQALIYGAGYVRVSMSCHTKVTKITGTINRNETRSFLFIIHEGNHGPISTGIYQTSVSMISLINLYWSIKSSFAEVPLSILYMTVKGKRICPAWENLSFLRGMCVDLPCPRRSGKISTTKIDKSGRSRSLIFKN